MAWTEQERALDYVQRKYGKTAYTEDTVNYKLVGYGRNSEKVFGIGDTWQEAIEALERKAER